MKRNSLARITCAALFLATLGWVLSHASIGASTRDSRLSPEGLARSFCVPIPASAKVAESEAADHAMVVQVPSVPSDSAADFRSVKAAQGEVIRFTVSSARAGAVGVHGLSDITPIQAGGTVTIAMRAIYSGRFPLHFHGTDGSHFELAAVEVRSADAQLAGKNH
ncbi:hypothetical protein PI87_12390 [Ralstonia sp. A12]|uniref:hypothetical protein n=1 Tax=Ralstonia sp. A12 TaxID=1217052 RepID=UPI000575CB4E|nr:hypothetical protein [Ralstonia sp. A12]KHK55805.1 hypothetical protein PI87_12390 [Ralstonia sp. A12]